MRRKRFSFLAGWAAVALLAVAGFAAFGNLGRPDSQQVQIEAARASMGHASGAAAGVAFVQPASLVSAPLTAQPAPRETSETTEENPESNEAATGTGSANLATGAGWLSEVQVRALVKLHFKSADVNQAIRVAWCESRFDPAATNLRTGGVGIFQHLPRYWEERSANAGFAGADPTDPEASIAAAAWEIYEGGGWELFCRG